MAGDRRSAASFAAISVFLLALLVVAGVAVGGRVASGQQDSATVTTPKNHFKVERPADHRRNPPQRIREEVLDEAPTEECIQVVVWNRGVSRVKSPPPLPRP